MRAEVKTYGGLTLIADADSVVIVPEDEAVVAVWDMRHGLTRDALYNKSIPFSSIKSMTVTR